MATKKRLIDANALQLEPDPWGGMNGVLFLGRSGGKTMAMVQSALKCMIDNAPTVDAVEVVRCRECTKARKEIALDNREYFMCKHTECCHGGDHFCSYGERRTDV